MSHTISAKQEFLTRVKKIIGQAQGLERALNSEVACLKFLQQVAALKGSVSGLMAHVLEDHIKEHLGTGAADAQQQEIDDLVRVIRSYMS